METNQGGAGARPTHVRDGTRGNALVGGGIESMVVTQRVPSVRSKVLQIPAGCYIESMVAAHCHNTEQPLQ